MTIMPPASMDNIDAAEDVEYQIPACTFTPATVAQRFKSWNTAADESGIEYNPGVQVKNLTNQDGATVTLFAIWISVDSFSITYNNTKGATNPNPNTFRSDETVVLEDLSTTGYNFVGWYDDENAGNKIDGWGVGSRDANVELWARWTVQSYTITYKDEGDVAFSGDNESSLITTHTYDAATDLVDGSKTGFTFDGWFKEENCSGSPVTSIGAQEITANLTLYAKWAPESP